MSDTRTCRMSRGPEGFPDCGLRVTTTTCWPADAASWPDVSAAMSSASVGGCCSLTGARVAMITRSISAHMPASSATGCLSISSRAARCRESIVPISPPPTLPPPSPPPPSRPRPRPRRRRPRPGPQVPGSLPGRGSVMIMAVYRARVLLAPPRPYICACGLMGRVCGAVGPRLRPGWWQAWLRAQSAPTAAQNISPAMAATDLRLQFASAASCVAQCTLATLPVRFHCGVSLVRTASFPCAGYRGHGKQRQPSRVSQQPGVRRRPSPCAGCSCGVSAVERDDSGRPKPKRGRQPPVDTRRLPPAGRLG